MTTDEQRKRQADALARDILKLSSNMLHVRLRFLDLALGELKLKSISGYQIGTDGQTLFYGPGCILRQYKAQQDSVARSLLHLLTHCILRHMFVGPVEIALWNLACDISAENVLLELNAPPSGEDAARRAALEWLASETTYLTAEHIYRYLQETPMEQGQLEALTALFYTDDHWPWYLPQHLQTDNNHMVLWNGASAQTTHSAGKMGTSWMDRWKILGHRMQVDLETSPQWGKIAGSFLQNLGQLNREHYDYTEFLKKFALPGEAMKINEDEFDQNFYTYGLELYRDMPLIEPLEYKEVKRVKEFVIAIDTSGSVAGALVQTFIQKTYNILKTTESFFTKINLHIIQCDAAIQEDAKITGQEELDRYLQTMTLRGFGGTDFRPVFAYVDSLIQKAEFINLKGLIYFTDGYGTFPEQKPAYQTAFLFIDQGQEPPAVPPWAIRLVLRVEDLDG